MGVDFKCGCRVSGGWYLCKKHESKLIGILDLDELNTESTISDIVQDKNGKTLRYINERPMKDVKD